VPFLIGSQLARFLRKKEIYGQLSTFSGWSDAVLFSLLLLIGFGLSLLIIRFGARLFGVNEDPLFGKFSPMVPILIPMAFTGELVYRLGYFAAGIGDFIPTLGRQIGVAFLEKFFFIIPDFPVQILSAFFMLNGSIAGCYILWQFCLNDFEGHIRFRNFIGINLLIAALLFFYLTVIF
jgi:hypothetical protein